MSQPREEPTLVDSPASQGPASTGDTQSPALRTNFTVHATTASGSGQTTAVYSILRGEEITRSVALMWIVVASAVAALIAVWLPRRISPGRLPATVIVGTTLLVSLWLIVEFRDIARFDRRKLLFHGLMCVASILSIVFYVGVFSPAIIALCIGIYFFALGDSPRDAWLIYGTGAFGYLLLSVLAVAGIVDVGSSVLPLHEPEAISMSVTAGVVQVLLGATLWMGRHSRRATLAAFDRLERASRQIRKRDALLDEARAELHQANAPGLGRYTGQQVDDYMVGEVIGRGAMGEVYRATNLVNDEALALKFLHASVLEEETHVQRFFREAEISSTLASPHIVSVLGKGHAPDGAPYIAMELLRGADLANLLREKKRLGTSATLDLVAQVAQALAVADEAGIVHRDLKPQNLVQSDSGARTTWKVLDFGVSKIAEASSNLTRGAAIGTPSYMSPEQARGESVDHRSDVFSLAVIAYRTLTGRPAFTGPDSSATLYNVINVQPARPGDVVRIGRDVERVLALGLAKDRERRFSSSAMFSIALNEAAKSRLDERLRRDADALLAEHPWGADLLDSRG